MQYYQPLLLTPGPTPVPEQILSAVQLPMVGHRSYCDNCFWCIWKSL